MALQVSTGFKTMLFGPYTFEGIFDNAVLRFYAGTQPTRANDGIGAAVLVGNGTADGASAPLGFARYQGIITNDAPWQMRGVATGNASWARLCLRTDTGGASLTLPRIDMPVFQKTPASPTQFGTYLSNIAFTAAYEDVLQVFYYTIPPL